MALLGALVTSALFAAAPALAVGPSAQQAVADLNAWRALAGVAPVTGIDPSLSQGCRLHNAYLSTNPDAGQAEDPSSPLHTPLGTQAAESSAILQSEQLPRAGFENGVFQRLALLAPRLATTWWDSSFGWSCIGVTGLSDDVRQPQLTLYPWPANGQADVPTTFIGDEHPSPYDDVPSGTQLGYLLSVGVNGPWSGASESHLTSVTLSSLAGVAVPVAGVDANSAHADLLAGGFAVFPLAPLAGHTQYVAHVTGYVTATLPGASTTTDLPFDYQWTFATVRPTPRTRVLLTSRGFLVRSPSRALAHLTLTRGTAHVLRHTVRPGGRWRVPVRPGSYKLCVTQAAAGKYSSFSGCFVLRVSVIVARRVS